MVITN